MKFLSYKSSAAPAGAEPPKGGTSHLLGGVPVVRGPRRWAGSGAAALLLLSLAACGESAQIATGNLPPISGTCHWPKDSTQHATRCGSELLLTRDGVASTDGVQIFPLTNNTYGGGAGNLSCSFEVKNDRLVGADCDFEGDPK